MTKLTNYIEKELKKGFSQQQIKTVLLKYGYDEQLVDEAFTEVSHHEFPQHTLEVPHMGKMMFGIAMAIIIAMAVLFSITFVQRNYLDKDVFLEQYQQEQAALAANLLKTTSCKEIENVDERDLCLLKLSAEKNDVSYCDAIETFGILADCKAKIWEKDACRYLDVVGEDSFDCYIQLSLTQNSIKPCYHTNNFTSCLNKVFTKTNNKEICNNDTRCIIELARISKDETLCESNLLDLYEKQTCTLIIKIDNGEEPLCTYDENYNTFCNK